MCYGFHVDLKICLTNGSTATGTMPTFKEWCTHRAEESVDFNNWLKTLSLELLLLRVERYVRSWMDLPFLNFEHEDGAWCAQTSKLLVRTADRWISCCDVNRWQELIQCVYVFLLSILPHPVSNLNVRLCRLLAKFLFQLFYSARWWQLSR